MKAYIQLDKSAIIVPFARVHLLVPCMLYNAIGLFIDFLFYQFVYHLLMLCDLVTREESSKSVTN